MAEPVQPGRANGKNLYLLLTQQAALAGYGHPAELAHLGAPAAVGRQLQQLRRATRRLANGDRLKAEGRAMVSGGPR